MFSDVLGSICWFDVVLKLYSLIVLVTNVLMCLFRLNSWLIVGVNSFQLLYLPCSVLQVDLYSLKQMGDNDLKELGVPMVCFLLNMIFDHSRWPCMLECFFSSCSHIFWGCLRSCFVGFSYLLNWIFFLPCVARICPN